MKRICTILFFCAVAALPGTTAPEAAPPAPAPKPAPAPAGPKPIKWRNILIQGSVRSRLEAWDWFTPDSGDPTYAYLGSLGRLSLSQNLEKIDWQLEFAVPVLLGLPNNAIAAGTQGQLGLGANYFVANDLSRNAIGFFPKQAWLRFKQGKHSVRIGRFEYLDGSETTPKNATLAALKRDRINQRLLGSFGWAHVGSSYDGLHYTNNRPTGNFTFVGALPTRGVFQTDGWGETNIAFGYAAYTKPWGKGGHAADTRVFAMHYDDWRQVLKTDNRALGVRRADTGNIRIQTFGGHSVHAFDTKKATFDVLLWGAGQTGRWGTLSHRAQAIDIEAGFQPKIAPKLKPWFRGGFYEGSGDANPGDSTHGAFFQILPTPRPFARFPFFNMINNRDAFGMMILRPHPKVTVSSEVHAMRLSNRNDLWYSGGGAFQPWTFGYTGRATSGARSLANLYDTSVEYRYRPSVTFTAYYGFAQGLAVTKAIYPKGKNGAFGYVEANYRF